MLSPSLARSQTLATKPAPRPKQPSRWVSWIPTSWASRLFMLITLLEAGADISIEAVLLTRYNNSEGLTYEGSDTFRPLPVFVLCFCLAHSYQVLLSIDACVNRNTILVAGLAIFNACFLVYAVIQISEIRQVLGDGVIENSGQHVPVQILTGAIPIVIGMTQVAYFVLGWYLWREFGWQIYKNIVGADRRLKKAFMQYQVYVVLLKFDFFAFMAFCFQLILVVLTSDRVEKVLTIIAAPLALLLLVFAWWSVRREKVWGMLLFMAGLGGAAFYFSWKLWKIWSEKTTTYAEVYKSLTVFCVLALVLVFCTLVLTVRCILNFGRGLSQAMDRHSAEKKKAREEGIVMMQHPGYGESRKELLPFTSSSTLHLPAQPRVSLD